MCSTMTPVTGSVILYISPNRMASVLSWCGQQWCRCASIIWMFPPLKCWVRPFFFPYYYLGSRHALLPATCRCDLVGGGSSIKRVPDDLSFPGSVYFSITYPSPQVCGQSAGCSIVPRVHASCTWRLQVFVLGTEARCLLSAKITEEQFRRQQRWVKTEGKTAVKQFTISNFTKYHDEVPVNRKMMSQLHHDTSSFDSRLAWTDSWWQRYLRFIHIACGREVYWFWLWEKTAQVAIRTYKDGWGSGKVLGGGMTSSVRIH